MRPYFEMHLSDDATGRCVHCDRRIRMRAHVTFETSERVRALATTVSMVWEEPEAFRSSFLEMEKSDVPVYNCKSPLRTMHEIHEE